MSVMRWVWKQKTLYRIEKLFGSDWNQDGKGRLWLKK